MIFVISERRSAAGRRRWLGAALLTAVAACGSGDAGPSTPGFAIAFESVAYAYDRDFVGGEARLVTLGDAVDPSEGPSEPSEPSEEPSGGLAGAATGLVRGPRLVDAFAAGVILHPETERVLALDVRVPGVKTRYRFDAEHTAAAYVMMQPRLWGREPEHLGRLYRRVQGHAALPELVALIEAAQAEGRAFYLERGIVTRAASLARDVAAASEEPWVGAGERADVLAYLTGEAVTPAKLASRDASRLSWLYTPVWPGGEPRTRAAGGQGRVATSELVLGLRDNAGILADVVGLDRYERGLLETLLASFARVVAPATPARPLVRPGRSRCCASPATSAAAVLATAR